MHGPINIKPKTCHDAFCLHVVSSCLCNPVFCPILSLFLIPVQFLFYNLSPPISCCLAFLHILLYFVHNFIKILCYPTDARKYIKSLFQRFHIIECIGWTKKHLISLMHVVTTKIVFLLLMNNKLCIPERNFL
jgi:hypothetical protein